MRSLMRRGRALVVRDRKLVLATPECLALCGCGCLYRRLLQCAPNPTSCDPAPPDPLELWICSTDLTCPIGSVLFIDGRCFRIMNETDPNPPEHLRIPAGDYECIGGLNPCTDPRCNPSDVLYYPARACGGDFGNLFVCGAPPECQIRGCIIVDGSRPGLREDQLPPGALRLRFADLGPRAETCCGNDCASCAQRDLLAYDHYNHPDTCYPWNQATCCCHIGSNGEPTTEFIVTQHRSVQRLFSNTGAPQQNGTINITATDPCNRIVHWQQRGLGLEDIDFDGIGSPMASCGFRCPGGWAPPFLRLTDVNGVQRLVGIETITWGRDCQGYGQQPDGSRLDVLTFNTTFSCRSVNHIAAYRYTRDFGDGLFQTIETTFQFSAIIAGDNRCTDCGGGVIGGGRPLPVPGDGIDLPNQPGVIIPATGCLDCGSGQSRTLVT